MYETRNSLTLILLKLYCSILAHNLQVFLEIFLFFLNKNNLTKNSFTFRKKWGIIKSTIFFISIRERTFIMEKLSRAVDRFCYKYPNFGIAGLMRYIIIANVFVFMMDMFTQGSNSCSKILSFIPYSILNDFEIWRLVTFIAIPSISYGGSMSILWFAISSMCYYFIGNSLEQRWGTTKFTVFYGLGVLLNLVGGLIVAVLAYTGVISEYYLMMNFISMYYVNLSMFFSIATLYPDLQFYIYFVIPVKAKWMGWLSGGLFAFDIISYLLDGYYFFAIVPVLALCNYFIFFWDDIASFLFKKPKSAPSRPMRTHAQAAQTSQTINLKKAQKEVQKQKGYLHKCTICGITDTSHPDTDFRYCSKCNGYHCYCMDHINDHEHIE